MSDKPILKSPKAVAVVAARVDGDAVGVLFKAADGQGIDLQIAPEVLPALTSGLIALLGQLGPKAGAGGISSQPITVTSARPAVGPQRQPILDLTIESGGHMPITFPRTAIEPLRIALGELLELSKPANKGH